MLSYNIPRIHSNKVVERRSLSLYVKIMGDISNKLWLSRGCKNPQELKFEWKAPHTHTQGMQGISGKSQHFRLSLLPQYGVFLISSIGPVFNVGCIFASLTWNIPFWCKIKLSWTHTDATKVTSYIQVLPKQHSMLKIKKVCLLAWNKYAKRLSFETHSYE